MKIAYFVNHYPKVSHSFIRREIEALEEQGITVERYALRGWDSELIEPKDLQERGKTRFVLQAGVLYLVARLTALAARRPVAFLRGLKLALQLGHNASRMQIHSLVALAEAAVLLDWFQAADIRHVHAHFGTNSAEVVMLVRSLDGPSYSFTLHGSEEWDMPRQLKIREKVRDAAFVVCISSFTRAQLCRWVPTDDWRKIYVVHCGLERSFHETEVEPLPDNHRLVCVGRLCRDKAQGLLIEAVGSLKRCGIRVELVLAGDGDTRAEIESLIAQNELDSQVRITGWISSDQVRQELLASRALVLPSFVEGLPVVLMEALALRRPVLTTYVGGIPELVRHGREGWLFPAGSLEALVEAIKSCLETSVEQLRAMGEQGRARVLERHSVENEVEKLSQLFRQVVQQ